MNKKMKANCTGNQYRLDLILEAKSEVERLLKRMDDAIEYYTNPDNKCQYQSSVNGALKRAALDVRVLMSRLQ